jgi:hypothetical protein
MQTTTRLLRSSSYALGHTPQDLEYVVDRVEVRVVGGTGTLGGLCVVAETVLPRHLADVSFDRLETALVCCALPDIAAHTTHNGFITHEVRSPVDGRVSPLDGAVLSVRPRG